MLFRLRTIARAIGIAILGASTSLNAQVSSAPTARPAAPVAQPVGQSSATPHAVTTDLTQEQFKQLYGGPIRPGVYNIKNGTGWCLTLILDPARPQQPELFQNLRLLEQSYLARGYRCNIKFFIMPHPQGTSYTIRGIYIPPINAAPDVYLLDRLAHCLTVARGVVLGPVRIDYRACDGRGPNAGAIDQRFFLKPVPTRLGTSYQVEALVADNAECWFDPELNGKAQIANILTRRCDATDDKDAGLFSFELSDTVWPTGPEEATLNRTGWYSAPDGIRRGFGVGAIHIPGNDYLSIPTEDDRGNACMRTCLEKKECKAWTWTAASFGAGSARPTCWIKDRIGRPINLGDAHKTTIFSGIVRP